MPQEDRKLFIQWVLAHHLFDLIPQALASRSQVEQEIKTCGLHIQLMKLYLLLLLALKTEE
jgi:hypothetical protein